MALLGSSLMEISSDMDECFRKVESALALFQWRRRRYRVLLPQGCFIVSSHGADRPMRFGIQRAIRKIRQSLCLVKEANTFAPVSQQPCVGEYGIASIFSRGAACAVAQVKHNGMNHARRSARFRMPHKARRVGRVTFTSLFRFRDLPRQG